MPPEIGKARPARSDETPIARNRWKEFGGHSARSGCFELRQQFRRGTPSLSWKPLWLRQPDWNQPLRNLGRQDVPRNSWFRDHKKDPEHGLLVARASSGYRAENQAGTSKIRANTVQGGIIRFLAMSHFLTLIQVFPVSGFLNVSQQAGCCPNTEFIALGTRL